MNFLKKMWVWTCRFRNRKGYGVHSPSAFYFIRAVINEKEAYYAYSELKKKRIMERMFSEKVDKLLFRLSNFTQPHSIVQVGGDYPLSLEYLSRGCKTASCKLLDGTESPVESLRMILGGKPLDLLHLTLVPSYQQWFKAALGYVNESSLIVVEDIHKSKEHYTWWKTVQQLKEVGITYDLYEVGLIFFDKSKIKQHYKVNFI